MSKEEIRATLPDMRVPEVPGLSIITRRPRPEDIPYMVEIYIDRREDIAPGDAEYSAERIAWRRTTSGFTDNGAKTS